MFASWCQNAAHALFQYGNAATAMMTVVVKKAIIRYPGMVQCHGMASIWTSMGIARTKAIQNRVRFESFIGITSLIAGLLND